jgi:ABC-type lipoprotein release transport system permease subunit
MPRALSVVNGAWRWYRRCGSRASPTRSSVSNLVIFLLLSAVLGLIAASWPARRAAKLDVLAAIASQ